MSALGILAVLTAWLVNLVGLPSQIHRNHRLRSSTGLCPRMLLLLQANNFAWTVYGFSIGNWYISASALPGFLCGLVLLYQWRKFRTSQPRTVP